MKRLSGFVGMMLFFIIFATTAQAKLVSNEVSYQLDGKEFKGYLAYDDAIKGKRPGVLVVHEWWGHTEFARERARALARMGYVAFSLDMYGDGKIADHPKDAGRFSGQVKSNMAAAQARFLAAREQLLASKYTDKDKIAAIGYCFGGGIVLEMVRRGVDLDGVVSFHGSLGTEQPASKGEVKAKVLVFNGADDPFVKPESITAFKREMQQAGVDFTFVSVAGAKHAFTNPAATAKGKKFDLPLEYNKQAAQSTWQQMKSFFDEIFN